MRNNVLFMYKTAFRVLFAMLVSNQNRYMVVNCAVFLILKNMTAVTYTVHETLQIAEFRFYLSNY